MRMGGPVPWLWEATCSNPDTRPAVVSLGVFVTKQADHAPPAQAQERAKAAARTFRTAPLWSRVWDTSLGVFIRPFHAIL